MPEAIVSEKRLIIRDKISKLYVSICISEKEGFLLFKKEKHTFLTFFFYQKRWKKEGKIAPPDTYWQIGTKPWDMSDNFV